MEAWNNNGVEESLESVFYRVLQNNGYAINWFWTDHINFVVTLAIGWPNIVFCSCICIGGL